VELLDLYDENAKKLGKTIIRGTPIPQGEFSLAVHIYIYNQHNDFLLQKRSFNKPSLPGIWSITCGAVSSGENSLDAAQRETAEEVGLVLDKKDFEFIARVKRKRSFVDIFFIKHDFTLDDCTIQEEEVSDIKFCTPVELYEMLQGTYNNEKYITIIRKTLIKKGLLTLKDLKKPIKK